MQIKQNLKEKKQLLKMDNYICKIATVEEMNTRWNSMISNAGEDKEFSKEKNYSLLRNFE